MSRIAAVTERYGFADERGNLIGYSECICRLDARDHARQLMHDHGYECVEMWIDARDENGELPASEVVS